MRLRQRTTINAPVDAVWELISDQRSYIHFMSGVTRWEVEDEAPEGCGTRIRMLVRVGAAEVGGLIEVVEWAPNHELAWTSSTGLDQRGRWRIRARGPERTSVELRFSYGVAGSGLAGMIAERIGAREVNRHLRKSVLEVKRKVESRRLERRHSPAPVA